jgi:hypothetical protein
MLKVVVNLAIILLLAGSITVGTSTPAAASDCYYGDYYDYRQASPARGVMWTGEVWYRIGFSCNGQGQSILVTQFHTRFDISEWNGANTLHQIGSARVGGLDSWPTYWEDGNTAECYNICTVEKWRYPNVTTPYNFDIETNSVMRTCGVFGSIACRVTHYFLRGDWEIIWGDNP